MAWAPDYITLAAFKRYVRIGAADALDDAELALAITAASRALDRETNRQFGIVEGAAEARTYTAEWKSRRGVYVVEIDDLQTLTDFVVTVNGQAVTDYTLLPLNAAQEGKPYERLHIRTATTSNNDGLGPTIDAAAFWGWTAVPTLAEQATSVQANRFLKRRESPLGIAGSPDLGNELRLLAKMDPDVAVMVAALRRNVPMI